MGKLVLGRQKGESIVLIVDGKTIVVTYVERVGWSGVRLAIEAPREVCVRRAELEHPESRS